MEQAIGNYDALKADAIASYVAKVDALKAEAQNDPNNVEYNETYETLLKNIRDAYANLETAELSDASIVSAHDAYAPYQEQYDSLVGEVHQAFIDKVNAISTAAGGDYANVEYNETFRALINEAKEAYAAIRDADKGAAAVVTKKTELDTAESVYLDGAATYAAMVKNLIAAIEPIAIDTSTSDAAIADARAAFDALFDEQKNDSTFISTNIPNYQRLLDAEAADPVAKQILAIGPSSESDFADKVAAAQIAYDALTADQKALISGAVSGILSDDVAALNVMNLIGDIGNVAYTAESKGKIDAARNAYDALTADQKSLVVNLDVLTKAEADYAAVKAVADEINAIGDITYDDASHAKIVSARSNYEALSDEQKAIFPASTKGLLENYEAAYAEMGEIEAIGTIENTPESKALVEAAKAGYDALSEAQKDLLDPAYEKTLLDDYAALLVMEEINAIGDLEYTPESKALIDAARAAYDALEADQKPLVANYDALTKAEEDYNAVKAVADEINDIGDITYDTASKNKIDAAREHYEALTNDQKAIFPLEWLENYEEAYEVMGKIAAIGEVEDTPESKALIEEAEAAYDAYKDAHQVNRLDPAYEKTLLDDSAAQDVIDAINAIGDLEYTPESKALIDAARAAYDALEADQKPLVANYDALTKAEADFAAVKGVADEVNAIGDITYDAASKNKIDAARDHYEALSDDQKAFFPIEELEAYEAAYAEMGMIEAIGTLTNTPESKALVETAKAGYDALSEAQKDLLDPAYEKALLDDYEALLVMEKINAIGDLEYTPECKALIDAARAAYDALSDDQKAILPNYETLTKDEADYAKVAAAVDKVTAIGDITCDDTSKALIDAARAEYEALSDDQKAFFPETSLTALENYEDAYATLEKIFAIGEVGYDTDSEKRIEEARAAYDDLTEEQKALIHQDDFSKLIKGEESFREQKTTGTVLSSVFLGVSGLALAAGIIFLIRLLKKKNNQGGTQVKSISILPLILTSYYLSGTFIALYIVAGLAIAVWTANLVIVIRNKKSKPALAQEPAARKPEASTEEEEVTTVTDEKGNVFQIRFAKSFLAKLSQSDDAVKGYYNELKNHALSYRKANSRVSWHFDSINVGRATVLKFAIRGKTLCLCLALNADDYADTKYKVEKAESRKLEGVSCLYRIKNDRRCAYAKDLIDAAMGAVPAEKGRESNEDFRLPYEETKALLEKGLIKELKTKVSAPKEEIHSIAAEKAEALMSDEAAKASIEADVVHHHRKGKKEIINIDTLSQNYQDGDTVTLDSLIEKGLVPAKTGYVKVLARGTLDKKLIVDLDDFSLQAVKMIVLLGGRAQKID